MSWPVQHAWVILIDRDPPVIPNMSGVMSPDNGGLTTKFGVNKLTKLMIATMKW